MVGNDAWRGDGGVKSKRSIGKLSLETQLLFKLPPGTGGESHWKIRNEKSWDHWGY